MNHQGNLEVLINEHGSQKKTANVIHKTYQNFVLIQKKSSIWFPAFKFINNSRKKANKQNNNIQFTLYVFLDIRLLLSD